MSTIGEIGSNIVQKAQDGAQYVADTISGNTNAAKAEANKEAVKSDNTTLGQKIDAGKGYVGNKVDEHTDKASAELHKQKAQN